LSNKISDKDKKDWENFLSSNEKLPNKDTKQNKKISKIKRIDLHGYTLQEANTSIEKFIDKSYDDGVSKIIVVTGKGLHSDNERDPYVSKDLSILKYSIPEFIKNNIDLMKKIIDIKEAEVEDGGSGAFYVFIKKKLK
jgi:DNA-nicking Smr family endonuclease